MNGQQLQERLGELVRLMERLGSDGSVIWRAMEELQELEGENERLKFENDYLRDIVKEQQGEP